MNHKKIRFYRLSTAFTSTQYFSLKYIFFILSYQSLIENFANIDSLFQLVVFSCRWSLEPNFTSCILLVSFHKRFNESMSALRIFITSVILCVTGFYVKKYFDEIEEQKSKAQRGLLISEILYQHLRRKSRYQRRR